MSDADFVPQLVKSAEHVDDQHQPPSLRGVRKRFSRKLNWSSYILVPLVLFTLALSTRHFTHPRALDVLHDNDWNALRDWSLHKRHPQDDGALTVSESATQDGLALSTSESATSTATPTGQAIPTIPTEAVVPTPFPQPWDSDIGQSYDSVSCFNFIANMTAAAEFRTCRPFSLLMSSSTALTKAQSNLTLSNSIVWGTCNPPPGHDTCVQNMAEYATKLQERCSVDLSKNNSVAMDALQGLQSYQLMYQTGCLSDPATDTYCYISAIQDSNPSDLYLYSLPVGLPLPQSAIPSCSACSKSLMSLYVDALDGGSQGGLEKDDYTDAEVRMEKACGQGFARSTVLNSGQRARENSPWLLSILLVGLALVAPWW